MDLQFGPYCLKTNERQLMGPDGPIELSARAFDILALLLGQPDNVIRKAALFDAVWPDLVVEENTLQVHMSALRKVLGVGTILTVHGQGYKYAGPKPIVVRTAQDAREPPQMEPSDKPHAMFNFSGSNKLPVTGGCLCGEIRYRISEPALDTIICHCRMCQKMSGAPFSVGSVYATNAVSFTKGELKYYKSSPFAERGFCASCGSSLVFRPVTPPVSPDWEGWILIEIGSLDNPAANVPNWHLGVESQIPWIDVLPGLKRVRCQDSPDVVEAWAAFDLPVP